jgi:beta-phosphoglucomutase
MKRFSGVIFDLDGVITDTARYHYLAWKRLAESQGVHFDEAANEHLKGIDRMGSLELILASSPRRYTAQEKLALATEKNEHYKELISTMTPADLLPGAVAALDGARAAGLRIGLASVSKNAFTVLERLGITDKFDYIVDAATVANSKPDPEIFLRAAQELGVPTSACFGVEDAVAGVASIKAAGMYAVGVGDPAVLTQADVVIPDLTAFDLARYQNT